MRDAGVPDGVFNMVAGPGETVGAELQENDGIDGIVFTGSFEVGFDLYKHFAKRYPKPVIVEMGGKNPAIVSQQRRPRRGGRRGHARRRSASAARSARPTAASTSSGRSTTSSCSFSCEKTEAITGRRPARSSELARPGHQRARAGPLRERSRRGAARRTASLIGGERVTEERPRHGLLRRADGRGRPADRATDSSRDELFVPFVAVAPVDSIDEALDLANDNDLGLTAGLLQRGRGRDQRIPRHDRGRRRLRQPPRRRDDRRVAGHPAVRRLEGLDCDRQGRRRPVLRPAVHARAVPDHRRLDLRPAGAIVRAAMSRAPLVILSWVLAACTATAVPVSLPATTAPQPIVRRSSTVGQPICSTDLSPARRAGQPAARSRPPSSAPARSASSQAGDRRSTSRSDAVSA